MRTTIGALLLVASRSSSFPARKSWMHDQTALAIIILAAVAVALMIDVRGLTGPDGNCDQVVPAGSVAGYRRLFSVD